jgi:AraC family transcriptional regulator
MLKLVVGEVVHGETPDPLWGQGMCIGIISRLATIFGVSEPIARTGCLDARRMRVVVERMADDVGARHTILELAHLADLSPAHFARAFKHETGFTPHTYLMRLRLERARARLVAGASIRDVATECGFADQAHLSRLFKRRYGLTPGELRRSARPA